MKNSNTALHLARRDALEARIGLRVAARLSERADQLSPDITERLRFAREKALERARAAQASEHTVSLGGGSSATLGRGPNWWIRFAAVLPAAALAAGLLLIQHWHTEAQIATAAEVDADLLADDLPPSAYGDAGFAEFLKTPRE